MCKLVRETSHTVTVWRTNTYCVPWFFQLVGGEKHGVGGSLDNSSFELFEMLCFLFPLLVLNVQKHVVQPLGQQNPHHRLAAGLL